MTFKLTLKILFKSTMNNLRLSTDPCGVPQLRLISLVSCWQAARFIYLPRLLGCLWKPWDSNCSPRTQFWKWTPLCESMKFVTFKRSQSPSFITREPQWLQSEVTIPSGASSFPGFIPRGQLRPSQVFQSQSREQKSLQCVECLAVCWSRPPVPLQSTPIDPSVYRLAENHSDGRFLGWIGEISGLPL